MKPEFEWVSPRRDLELMAELYGKALDADDHVKCVNLAMAVAGPRFINVSTQLLLAMCGRSDSA